MKRHIPNILTVFRGILTIFMIPLFFFELPFQFVILYGLFIIASTTDFLDGYLARKWKCESEFGKIFDPLFDKILTISLFVLLVPFQLVPSWLFILLIIRELLIDSLKSFMLYKGIVVPARRTGKLKFVFQILFFHFAFLILLLGPHLFLQWALYASILFSLVFAYISAILYIKQFIKTLKYV